VSHDSAIGRRARRPKITPVKLRIDAEACTGHGRCYVLAPEVFEPDDEGHSVGLFEDVPPELLDKAQLAVANCPESAITLVD
jgi:ferredoxin